MADIILFYSKSVVFLIKIIQGNKKKKLLLGLFLTAAPTITLASCGKDKENDDSKDTTTIVETTSDDTSTSTSTQTSTSTSTTTSTTTSTETKTIEVPYEDSEAIAL